MWTKDTVSKSQHSYILMAAQQGGPYIVTTRTVLQAPVDGLAAIKRHNWSQQVQLSQFFLQEECCPVLWDILKMVTPAHILVGQCSRQGWSWENSNPSLLKVAGNLQWQTGGCNHILTLKPWQMEECIIAKSHMSLQQFPWHTCSKQHHFISAHN